MYVIVLRHDAVLRYAGSYDISPPSSPSALIWRRSGARIVPSTIGSVYSRPVRLSVIVRVSDDGKAGSSARVRGCQKPIRSRRCVVRAARTGCAALRTLRSGGVAAQLVTGAVDAATAQRHLVVLDLEHLEPLRPQPRVDGRVRRHRQDPAAAERHQVAAEADALAVRDRDAADAVRVEPVEGVALERVVADQH